MTDVASVLIVDDSRVQRDHIAGLCRALGIAAVHTACDGLDALRQLVELASAPSLIIIDLEMPVMDGVELIDQLRQRGSGIPFIVASSRDSAVLGAVRTMARTQGLPMLQTLRKPLTEASLRGAMSAQGLTPCEAAGAEAAASARPPIDLQALAAAIARHAIVPHYQPKIDARSGVIRGVEVLARWPDPALGNPTPDRFIAAAEAHGQIHALTLSVLDQSLAQAARWKARGLVLSLAVNLSPLLLERTMLVDEIEALAMRHGIPAGQIVLELTEGSVVATQGAALGVLARLRMKGYGLSIDDFGTGFSSLQQLTRLPFTELKIDRSFVDGAHRHDHLRAILESSIRMATRLGLASIAEGVETIEDWRLLQGYGCTMGQGWLFGRAMPGSELPTWMKRHAERLGAWRGVRTPSTQAGHVDAAR